MVVPYTCTYIHTDWSYHRTQTFSKPKLPPNKGKTSSGGSTQVGSNKGKLKLDYPFSDSF